MAAPPDDDSFDALSAAAELDEALTRAPSDLEAELVILRARVADLERGLAAADARADRAEEEIDRARARLARENERELAARSARVILDLLAVLDDLDRAVQAARAAGDASALLAGIELVQRKFLAALAAHGVVAVPAAGATFDPAVHEAVSVVPAASAADHDRVVAVLREGYRRGDELLRPAAVVVARAR
jgi:molecular chaperone GrpE